MYKKSVNIFFGIVLFVFSICCFTLTAKAEKETSENITLYIGDEYKIDETFEFTEKGMAIYAWPTGKYLISDTNIVGIRSSYNKKNDYFNDYIVALHSGKATITVLDGKKVLYKYHVTVKLRTMASPTNYFVLNKDVDNKKGIINKSKNILKSLNLASYNTDRERLYTIAQWFNDHAKYDDKDIFEPSMYYALTGTPENYEIYVELSDFFLRSLGFETDSSNGQVKLDGNWYSFSLADFVDGKLDADYKSNTDNIPYTCISSVLNNPDELYYQNNTKTHLPSWLIDITTPQQNLLVGDSINLPDDVLSSNTVSSDPSVVAVENDKLVGKGTGNAIVYRYNDTYCDIFYVLVESNNKPLKKTISFKKTASVKTSYSMNDFTTYRSILNHTSYIGDVFIYNFEPAISSKGKLITSYDTGKRLFSAYILMEDGTRKLVFDDKNFEE
jgi:hypothetical protein